MNDGTEATRRTVLHAAGVTLATAALGSVAYATNQTATQDGSGASVDWYDTYTGDESLYFFHSLMETDTGYTAVGGGRITEIAPSGETRRTNEHPYGVRIEDTVQTTDGNYFHVGSDNYESKGGGKYALAAKTDRDGNELWQWDYEVGEGTNTKLSGAVAAPSGGAYAFGHNSDEEDPFGVRFDAVGNVVWLQVWSTSEYLNDDNIDAIPATNGGALVWDFASAGRVTPDGALDWSDSYEFDSQSYSLMNAIPQRDGSGYVVTAKIFYNKAPEENDTNDQNALLYLDEDGGSRSVHFDVPNPEDAGNASLDLHLARTDDGLVIGSTSKKRIGDSDGDGDEDYDFDAWLLGLTPQGQHRWYLRPGDASNYDRAYAMVGSGQSVVLGGGWHEGHHTFEDDPRDSFVTRVSEPTEDTPTETGTPTLTDTGDDTSTETESATETSSDEASPTSDGGDEGDCTI